MTHGESLLSGWESFYVIVGSSGAALIGLQFVMITLISALHSRTDPGALTAFGSPTVVHFAGALVISAVMSVPWPSLVPPCLVLSLGGLAGLVYGAVVLRRARRQSGYAPVWEDWVWYMIVPDAIYLVLLLGAALLCAAPGGALFAIGAAALGLLLVGIHNAWDAVTHLVMTDQGGGPPPA